MSIQGVLSTDDGMRELDRILDTFISADDSFDDALVELSLFFIRHLKTKLFPITAMTEFPSSIQKQVYTWIESKYNKFCEYLNNNEFPLSESVASSIGSILLFDPNKTLIPAAAAAFIRNGIFQDESEVTSMAEFQDEVYQKVVELLPDRQEIALRVLTTEFPNPIKSNNFSTLFLKFVSLPPSDESIMELFHKFDSILSRVDDKLITYDFLHQQFDKGSIFASLSLPFLVSVAQSRAVDAPKFYQIAFKAITPQSLSSPHRSRFLDTLIRVLSPKTRPAAESIAFAVKLSRMLPLVPVDAQLDILSILQALVRAHECVAELLEPKEGPISNVDGELEDCQPQTLWEVRALRNSEISLIAEQAKTLGQRWVPPDFCSFKLAEAIESCKAKPKVSERIGNWGAGLDPAIWNFR
ncbi:hypothetical protein TRFO_11288 [Tritrichomonas foetus]|uniref:CCAAT-binding factor domain-containing protein n=1 Tax=Tritrichomonas foetus TaxID=1144522 RepID=A0A1J4JAC4_9EUKA|nr:hypothetical protein TRFO_11288 [Tritrichomonas foetus]|eukprot:OHS94212.1 hypothetical protein TRFO_11288 [Tritrichomonas foetus]